VLSTDPGPGDRVRKDGTVTLVLSDGPERYAVPALAGRTLTDARNLLAAQHLSVGTQTQQYSDTVPAGTVISSNPASGTLLRRDAAVRLVVSRGQSPATVPQFVGMSVGDATNLAQAKHLTLATAQQGQYSQTVPKNVVLSQDVPAGTQVARGTTVTVVLSLGPPLVTVPDVFRLDRNQAKRILQKAGFKVVFSEPFGVTPFNEVYSQDPGGGSKAPMGSTVNLAIF